jgi:hypothetical protein
MFILSKYFLWKKKPCMHHSSFVFCGKNTNSAHRPMPNIQLSCHACLVKEIFLYKKKIAQGLKILTKISLYL